MSVRAVLAPVYGMHQQYIVHTYRHTNTMSVGGSRAGEGTTSGGGNAAGVGSVGDDDGDAPAVADMASTVPLRMMDG